MLWSHDFDINLDSYFASNQTSNNYLFFHPKILHTSFLAFELYCHQAPYCCHLYFSCIDSDTTCSYINLDITFYTSALALSRAEVLHIFQSHCLLARKDYLQISTFLDLVIVKQEEVPYALQKKATERATSKMVRSWLARYSRPDPQKRQHQLLSLFLFGGGLF